MKIVTAALFGILTASVGAQEVSVKTLLPQMTDMTFLTHRPNPYFTMAQSSSYDRRTNTSPTSDPFANGDAGNFLRAEQTPKGIEYVMADLKGPGAVVRLWSANPSGTIKFYFDGETTPRISVKLSELLNGKVPPFTEPFGYNASSGTNLYFPFPYAKSLKITANGDDGGHPTSLYYHVGFRSYTPGTRVKTFTWDDCLKNKDAMAKQAERLVHPTSSADTKVIAQGNITQGGALVADLKENISSAIRTLQIQVPVLSKVEAKQLAWEDPRQTHNVLRNLLLKVSFDGETCIETPLGDFFGSAPGINPYENVPMGMAADGTLTCRFVMPFEHAASIRIENLGPEVPITVKAAVKPYPWSPDTYLFHAQWLGEIGRTRPFRDMKFLDVKGEGLFVGTSLSVGSPVATWWGEGDEKAWVDGESFPSTFGTGTEDYYGYAWGSPELFFRPYHAQPRCDGPGSMGHTSLNRWQIFDPISYSSSLKFNVEMWHWADVTASFLHTTYWYAKPGGTPPAPVDRSLLAPLKIEPPKPVEGAIEGESLEVVSKTGGTTEIQEGFFQTSGGKQLWWKDAKPGEKLVLKLTVPEDGSYEVAGNFCVARDYGIHRIRINGKQISPIDFFAEDIGWKKLTLGTFTLAKGEAILEIECTGHRPQALPSNMFAIDYLLLNKKG